MMVSLGRAYRDAVTIKGLQQQNVLSGINIETAQRRERNLRKLREARAQFKNGADVVKNLRDQGAHDAADQFIRTQREMKATGVQFLQTLAPAISTPGQYEKMRSQLINEGLIEEEDLPAKYSKGFLRRLAGKEAAKLKEFDVAVGVKAGVTQRQQIVVDQATGREIYRSPAFPDPKSQQAKTASRRADIAARTEARKAAEDKGESRLETKVSSEIRRQAAILFGGTYNPRTQAFAISDKTIRAQALRVAAQAERYAETGMPAGQAVQQAAADNGVRDLGVPTRDDPSGLRGIR